MQNVNCFGWLNYPLIFGKIKTVQRGETMVDNNTTIFNVTELRQELIMMTLNEVVRSLENNGYNATNQLVGYILTDDLSYITSKEDARKKLSKFSREELLMAILNGYLGR